MIIRLILKPEFIFISIDWSHPTCMCYHNTNGLVVGDVIMLLQKARLKKNHNTLIFATINIINTLLPVHALLDWQIGNVGIIEGLVGKLSDWNMWCSCYQKAWSFSYSNNSNTRKKWFCYLCNKFATPGNKDSEFSLLMINKEYCE